MKKVEASFLLSASFSQDWLRDAYKESQEDGPDHRRREILFSVCLVETYLFEWVRDMVIGVLDYTTLETYFPPRRQLGIEGKFKTVLTQLQEDGRIPGVPDLSRAVWNEFVKVVRFRDALVHASLSRPEILEAGSTRKIPALELSELAKGWAREAARALLLSMHEAAKTQPEGWLLHPEILPQA